MFRRGSARLMKCYLKHQIGLQVFQVGIIQDSVLKPIGASDFTSKITLGSVIMTYMLKQMCLPPVMRSWISHLRDGLLNALMTRRCSLVPMICMLLLFLFSFFFFFEKRLYNLLWLSSNRSWMIYYVNIRNYAGASDLQIDISGICLFFHLHNMHSYCILFLWCLLCKEHKISLLL